MPVRRTLQDMQDLAAIRGGKCLSKEYINQFVPLKWMCEKGHTWDMDYKATQQGAWCVQCISGERKQVTLEALQQIAKELGGKLLSTVYINTHAKLE